MDAGTWPADWPPPPRFDRMIGIERRRRVAKIARAALESDAEVIVADVRTLSLEPFRVVLLFDVLQLLAPDEQEALMAAMTARLEPGGVILVREADASAGSRFDLVRLGNRLKLFVSGSVAPAVSSAFRGRDGPPASRDTACGATRSRWVRGCSRT